MLRLRDVAARLGERARVVLRDPAGPVIVAVLAIGIFLRVALVVSWHPAFVNYSDTGVYIQDAYDGGFHDPLRVVGYGLFLIPLHWITPHLLLVVLVQHLMGLATGVLLYLTVRRAGAPRAIALLPFAMIILGGTQIFLEHAILSESLFTFLIALALYAGVRAPPGSPWWAALAGVCLGLGTTVRGAGIVLIPIVAVWLVFALGRPAWRDALRGAAVLMAAFAVIGGYVVWRHAETGLSGLTTNGNWNLYGRVAPFADCTRFTPPPGTRRLCDPTPPDQRDGRNAEWYIYDRRSPAQALFGPPYDVSSDPQANDKLRRWSIAAIQGQPGDYANAVWQDLIRIVDPDHQSSGDLSYNGFIPYLLHGLKGDDYNYFVEYWRGLYYPGDNYHFGDISKLTDYERATRVQGPLMIICLLLAAAAPWVAPRGSRMVALLLAGVAFAMLVFPILTHAYDARFIVPALGPLIGAAALGGWGLGGTAARAWRARGRGRSVPPSPPDA